MSEILMTMSVESFTKYLHSNFSLDPGSLASLGDKFRQLLVSAEAPSAREKLHKIQLFWRAGQIALPDRTGSNEPPKIGVLKASGYYVSGSTLALPVKERRSVLRYIMTEDDLPPIKDKVHMQEWGKARSIPRFAKLEAVLGYLENNAANDPLLQTPRIKWAEDYAFVAENADRLLSPDARKKKEELIEWYKNQLLKTGS